MAKTKSSKGKSKSGSFWTSRSAVILLSIVLVAGVGVFFGVRALLKSTANPTEGMKVLSHNIREQGELNVRVRIPTYQLKLQRDGDSFTFPPNIDQGTFSLVDANGGDVGAFMTGTSMEDSDLAAVWEEVMGKKDGANSAPMRGFRTVNVTKLPKNVSLWVHFEATPDLLQKYRGGGLHLQLRDHGKAPLEGELKILPAKKLPEKTRPKYPELLLGKWEGTMAKSGIGEDATIEFFADGRVEWYKRRYDPMQKARVPTDTVAKSHFTFKEPDQIDFESGTRLFAVKVGKDELEFESPRSWRNHFKRSVAKGPASKESTQPNPKIITAPAIDSKLLIGKWSWSDPKNPTNDRIIEFFPDGRALWRTREMLRDGNRTYPKEIYANGPFEVNASNTVVIESDRQSLFKTATFVDVIVTNKQFTFTYGVRYTYTRTKD